MINIFFNRDGRTFNNSIRHDGNQTSKNQTSDMTSHINFYLNQLK